MSFQTALSQQLGIECPLIQAPMAGGGDTVELVAAVSNAGGLGTIGAAYLSPQQIVAAGKAVRERTSRPFGINLFAPAPAPVIDPDAVARAVEHIGRYYRELGLPAPEAPSLPPTHFDEQLAASLDTDAAVFSFIFNTLPNGTVEEIKRRGKFLVGTATTVEEARILVDHGVDAVVAQGSEAGGHRGSFPSGLDAGMVGTMALVPQIVDAVPVPVIAAGGIMDGRGIAAALTLGAGAVQLGTAFLTSPEAGVADAYKDAILAAHEDQTRITRAFSGRPARGIANKVLTEYEGAQDRILPFPLQNALTRGMRTQATRTNRAEYLSLWAGQGIRMARRLPAAELVAQLKRETEQAFDALESRLRTRVSR